MSEKQQTHIKIKCNFIN